MQIDFHLGTTFVLARMAGFTNKEANIIASSAQYVDDAVKSGTISFNTRAAFTFIASAHKMLDYRNFRELSNHNVWIPFHFLPGDQVLDSVEDKFVSRLVCRPNSAVAQEMLANCTQNFKRPYGMHLLGITSHVYVDTWAHQGFLGLSHELNKIEEIYQADGMIDKEMARHRKKFFRRTPWRVILDKIQSLFIGEALPVGHGCALSYPDLPYLKWSYKNWRGDKVERNNPKDFMEASKHLLNYYIALRKEYNLHVPTVNESDFLQIEALFKEATSEEGDERLEIWQQAITSNKFSFGSDLWNYTAEGEGSWLDEAFPFHSIDNFIFKNVEFKNYFMNSNWKQLHDALIFHRFSLIHEILPARGLSVA